MMKDLKILLVREFNFLKRDIRKEYNFFMTFSFKNYIKRLFFPKDYRYLIIILRIVTLYIVFRFIFDIIFLICWVVFNFYFVILDRIFNSFRNLTYFFFGQTIISRFFFRLINIVRYVVLLIFFVNIYEDFKRKKLPLWGYILDKLFDLSIIILRKRIKFRYIFYPILKLLETIVIFIHLIVSLPFGLLTGIKRIYEFFYMNFFLNWYLQFKIMKLVMKLNMSERSLLNDVLLIHTSLDLQKLGYVAPKADAASKGFGWYRYLLYCKKFYKAEIKPFPVNSETIDIYLLLRDLVRDTRYQRKPLRYFDSFVIMFPYSYIVPIYLFFVNLFRGFLYFLYSLFIPFYPICFFIIFLKSSYDYLHHCYMLTVKDFDSKIAKQRIRELQTEKMRRYIYSWIDWINANRKKYSFKRNKKTSKKK